MNVSTVKPSLLTSKCRIRNPQDNDAMSMWRLVESSKTLDHNSFYCYFLLSHFFSSTCAIADVQGDVVGFATGFLMPEHPNTYFVWQVRVVEKMRGLGLARSLLEFILDNQKDRIEYVEATIYPNNFASKNLFNSIAKSHNAQVVEYDNFLPVSVFPKEADIHEQENLFRIGPLNYAVKSISG